MPARGRSRSPRRAGSGEASGTVKSFNGTWGFLVSPEVTGDIFCHVRDSPQFTGPLLQPGETVAFKLVQSTQKGRNNGLQAADVQRKVAGGNQRRAHMAMTDAGQQVTGTLKKIRNDACFCSVEGMADDVFLGAKSLMESGIDIATLREGDTLTFELAQGPKGYHATSLWRTSNFPISPSGQRATGVLKKIRDGMGFCQVEGVADDVLLGSRSLSSSGIDVAALVVGDTLTFDMAMGPKGYHASNIQRTPIAQHWGAGQRVTGRPKGYHASNIQRAPIAQHWEVGQQVKGILIKKSNGKGFCSVEGITGDVLLGERSLMDSGVDLNTIQIGDTLIFEVSTGPKGYHATKIQQIGGRVTGTLRKIGNGRGFCSVEGIAGDVLLGERSLMDSGLDLSTMQLGDTFDFEIAIGSKGYHATDIQRAVHAQASHRGQQATGRLKKIGKGVAFCAVDGIASDVLLGERSLTESGLELSIMQVGETLAFDLAMGSKGYYASNISRVTDDQPSQLRQQVTGTLRKIHKSMGFCSVEDVDGDVLLGPRSMRESDIDLSSLQLGEVLVFDLQRDSRGYHATNIRRE